MSKKITLEIKSEHSNQAESFYHEIVKMADEAANYGAKVDVRRVEPESEHTGGFDE